MTTDELLREAFEYDGEIAVPAPVETIHRRARGRRRRAGGGALVAVVIVVMFSTKTY